MSLLDPELYANFISQIAKPAAVGEGRGQPDGEERGSAVGTVKDSTF